MSTVLVAVTQRVIMMPRRNERGDMLDQSWAQFLETCGLDILAIPNDLTDPVGYAIRRGVGALLLTGGNNISPAVGTLSGEMARLPACENDLAPERDRTETALLRASVEHGWPVIGVCRGMQVLSVFHGGTLRALANHAAKRHGLVTVATDHKFDAEVNSFHDFGVPPHGEGPSLRVLATADDWPEAVEHPRFRHLGIMWHPERNRPSSVTDISLFREYLHGAALPPT